MATMHRTSTDKFLTRIEAESGLELPDAGAACDTYAGRAEWLLAHHDHARLTVEECRRLSDIFEGREDAR